MTGPAVNCRITAPRRRRLGPDRNCCIRSCPRPWTLFQHHWLRCPVQRALQKLFGKGWHSSHSRHRDLAPATPVWRILLATWSWPVHDNGFCKDFARMNFAEQLHTRGWNESLDHTLALSATTPKRMPKPYEGPNSAARSKLRALSVAHHTLLCTWASFTYTLTTADVYSATTFLHSSTTRPPSDWVDFHPDDQPLPMHYCAFRPFGQ
jgi:hypothetical protein